MTTVVISMDTILTTRLTGHADLCFTDPGPMSLERAHRVSQQHAHYPGSPCTWRTEAHRVLKDAGHLTPDHTRLADWTC
jgi:hypothetical protein